MRARSVGTALASIREPNLAPEDLQVIVVDNASGDNIAEVVNGFRSCFANLTLHIWDRNVGPVENWRRGLAVASAPWVKILWSDDQLEPRAIEHMLAAAARNFARVVTCRAAVDYPDGSSANRYLDRPTTLTPDVLVSELLHFPAGLPASPGAALVRTQDARAALDAPLPRACTQRAIGPDLAIVYWGVFAGGTGVHLPDVLARFSAGEDSITVRTPRSVLSSCYTATIDTLLDIFGSSISPTTLRRLHSRSALDGLLGGEPEALLSQRRLSLRATAYDTFQLTRYAVRTHLLRRKTI